VCRSLIAASYPETSTYLINFKSINKHVTFGIASLSVCSRHIAFTTSSTFTLAFLILTPSIVQVAGTKCYSRLSLPCSSLLSALPDRSTTPILRFRSCRLELRRHIKASGARLSHHPAASRPRLKSSISVPA